MIFVKPLFFEFEPIKIANVSENGNVQLDLSIFIGIYEKKCLIEVLGLELYQELAASFDFAAGVFTLKSNATTPIKNLVNGVEYDKPVDSISSFDFDNSESTKRIWKGIVQTDSYVVGTEKATIKKSFIADYIYYHYYLTNRSITAGTGQQVLAGENSTTVSNFSKRIDRYNEFVFTILGGIGHTTSLYQFLQDRKSEYPTWVHNCQIYFKDKY